MKVEEAGIHLNGRLSVGENIADNAGVKTALKVLCFVVIWVEKVVGFKSL